jgi:ribosome-interacting GTPase 1
MKYASVWGIAVHDVQMVQRNYVLHDGDIIEILIQK